MACDCDVMAHVMTQIPYSLIASILSVLFGTLPSGLDFVPNPLCIFLLNYYARSASVSERAKCAHVSRTREIVVISETQKCHAKNGPSKKCSKVDICSK